MMTDQNARPAYGAPLLTPLHEHHLRLGARMVVFAGYEMPVQYRDGIIAEHLHTRAAAGLFDVSHMGQAFLSGADYIALARSLEALTPADLIELLPGQQKYTQLLNADGGIIDDLMVSRPSDPQDQRLMLVVNAARKPVVFPHIKQSLPAGITLTVLDDHALLALQGPLAVSVLERNVSQARAMRFMSVISGQFDGVGCTISRSGYTGEDGFEISMPAADAPQVFSRLIEAPEVRPIGLGARDTLRLEAGLCLYGHDISETTSPVEAALSWSIGKRRRREGGFPGEERIRSELANGASRRRVGMLPDGRAPAREGASILSGDRIIGAITSGTFSPTLKRPISMGYIETGLAKGGSVVALAARDKKNSSVVTPLPFVPHRYHREKESS
ncbi:MAG: glycine cleavage system aminomethyltransferase GcvT [Rhizobiales bacterium]|nr:glycine cleavage system aminomethyltransferase GcvT [Hyphomicrobiales bacterium]